MENLDEMKQLLERHNLPKIKKKRQLETAYIYYIHIYITI